MNNEPRGFADSDLAGRTAKARKIEVLLGQQVDLTAADCLDLGSGSGILSSYFAPRVRSLVAADRSADEFIPRDIEFKQIGGPQLPFDNNSFDAVIFNHVIEHVGDRPAQDQILREIRRCLRPQGTLYIAVPNQWAPVEPHYGLPFLGALPRGLADRMIRSSGKGAYYDCYPMTGFKLRRMLLRHFEQVRDVTGDAFVHYTQHEMGEGWKRSLARSIPNRLVTLGSDLMPTQMALASGRRTSSE